MELRYYHNIDKIEYYDLDKWFETFVRQHSWALDKCEIKLIEKENGIGRCTITIRINGNSKVCMYLYLLGKRADEQVFEFINTKGIGEKLIKMLSRLKG